MRTSEEVSVRQEVKGKSSVINIKEMEGAILACVSLQAQKLTFSHHTSPLRSY
jgi:hypothetical protein